MLRSSEIKLRDRWFVAALFLTPLLQIGLNWGREKSLSIDILGCNFIVTEFFWFLLVLGAIFLHKRGFKKITFLICGGLLISFLSCLANGYNNWFSRFLVGSDFYVCGLLFSLITIEDKHFRLIRPVLFFAFCFIALQQIFVSLGFVRVDSGNVISNEMSADTIIRYGTSVGSVNQTGYLLFILMGILLKILRNKYYVVLVIILGALSIFLTLSRGPILSLSVIAVIYLLLNIKDKRVQVGVLILYSVFVIAENRIGVISAIAERNETTDITSGREDRWGKSIDIYRKSSFFWGAGNGITPSEKGLMSEISTEREIRCSPHNVYLSYLVENGIFGLILFVSLVIYLLLTIYKKKPKIDYTLLTFVILPVTLMNTEIILRNSIIAFFFWLLYVLIINRVNAI